MSESWNSGTVCCRIRKYQLSSTCKIIIIKKTKCLFYREKQQGQSLWYGCSWLLAYGWITHLKQLAEGLRLNILEWNWLADMTLRCILAHAGWLKCDILWLMQLADWSLKHDWLKLILNTAQAYTHRHLNAFK